MGKLSTKPKNDHAEYHESYGLVSLSRYTVNPPQPMFGSSIMHSSGVHLQISRARKERSLSSDHFYQEGNIIQISLTATQLGELISHTNTTGVPCTIDQLNGRSMEQCPETNERKKIENEFAEYMKRAAAELDELVKVAETLQEKPSINKADRKVFLDLATSIRQQLSSNLPFIQGQFNEAVENTVAEAKSDLNSWIRQTLEKFGMEALPEKLAAQQPQLLEAPHAETKP